MGRSYVQQGVNIGVPRYSFDPRKGDEFFIQGKKTAVKRMEGDYVHLTRSIDGMSAMSVSNLYQMARVPETSRFAPYEVRVRHQNGKRRKANASGGPLDTHAARELELYVKSDGQLYRSQYQPIQKNLITKMARGVYNHDKAVKLFGYLMESGAKKYAKEFSVGTDWSQMFSPATRKAAAEEFTRHFEVEAKLGNYDNYLPKKYQKKNPSPALRLIPRNKWTAAWVKGKDGKKVRGHVKVLSDGTLQARLPRSAALKMNPAHTAWKVYLNGKHIDTVFYTTSETAESVKRSLVNHDGYDYRIVVKKEGKENPSKGAFEVQYFDGNNWKFLITSQARSGAAAIREARKMFTGKHLPLKKLRAVSRKS